MRLLAGIVAVATLAVPPLHFPRDHFAHRAGIEWWYFTAYVHGSDGHRYSVFFTLFKRGGFVLPVSQVVNLDTGKLVGHSEQVMTARTGSTGLSVHGVNGGLTYVAGSRNWALGAKKGSYLMSMIATPEKPYVLHGGGTGFIRQGSATSNYYSSTRMKAGGIIVNGRRRIEYHGHRVVRPPVGELHEQPEREPLGLVLLPVRRPYRADALPLPRRPRERHRRRPRRPRPARDELRRQARERAYYRAVGRSWPLDWTLTVPGEHLTERLHAIVPDQLFRSLLLPTFWEGAVTATGTKDGVCFVEETS